MNGNNPNVAMVPPEEGDRKPVRPGEDLTPEQRAVCEAVVADGLTWAAAARARNVPMSNAYYWRDHCPGFMRYVNHLTNLVLSESERIVKIKLAARAPAAAERLGQLATSRRAKPSHPYQVDAASRLLDRVGGKAAPAKMEVAAEFPTVPGDPIRIIFRSTASHEHLEEEED